MNNFNHPSASRSGQLNENIGFGAGGLVGEVRRPGMSYRIRLTWENGRLWGRLGGAVFGENLHLETHGNQILGSVASSSRVLSLHGQQEAGRLEYRLVGGRNLSGWLELRGNGLAGRVYAEEQSYGFSAVQGGASIAQIGDDSEAQQIVLESNPLPPLVLGAALLAADVASREAWRALLNSYQGIAEG
ncbi:MAG: hypothetical protein IVW51_03825 [Thermaceae bacterium]|nr:hypothetical protein [Thermaceae bacterium]